MRMLHKLISQKVAEGKSLRQIAKESGVEYTSVHNYYHRPETEPRGKNLKLLADYFGVHFADLVDDVEDQSFQKRFLAYCGCFVDVY